MPQYYPKDMIDDMFAGISASGDFVPLESTSAVEVNADFDTSYDLTIYGKNTSNYMKWDASDGSLSILRITGGPPGAGALQVSDAIFNYTGVSMGGDPFVHFTSLHDTTGTNVLFSVPVRFDDLYVSDPWSWNAIDTPERVGLYLRGANIGATPQGSWGATASLFKDFDTSDLPATGLAGGPDNWHLMVYESDNTAIHADGDSAGYRWRSIAFNDVVGQTVALTYPTGGGPIAWNAGASGWIELDLHNIHATGVNHTALSTYGYDASQVADIFAVKDHASGNLVSVTAEGDLDMHTNRLRNGGVAEVSSAPPTGVTGMVWLDTGITGTGVVSGGTVHAYADHSMDSATRYLLCHPSGSLITVTMPAVASVDVGDNEFHIKKVNGSHEVKIIGAAGEMIDEAYTEKLIADPRNSVLMQTDGTGWYIH